VSKDMHKSPRRSKRGRALAAGCARYGKGLWLTFDYGDRYQSAQYKNKGTDGTRDRYCGSLRRLCRLPYQDGTINTEPPVRWLPRPLLSQSTWEAGRRPCTEAIP
jgi:hypothetical protein